MKKQSLLTLSVLCAFFIMPLSVHAQYLEVEGMYGNGVVSGTSLITSGVGIHNGRVWVWGFKGSGQQGNGVHAVVDRPPKMVTGNDLQNIISVTGGAYHILAVDNKGRIYSWGQNIHGEAGCDGTPNKNYVLKPCLIRKEDGTPFEGVSQAVSAGEYHSVYLDKTGDVYVSGLYTLGRIGQGNTAAGLKDARVPKKVNIGGEHARLVGAAYEGSFAVTYEGNVWAWGDNENQGLAHPQKGGHLWVPTKIANLKPYAHDIVKIGGGQGWGQALLKDGRVIGWGRYWTVGNRCNTTKYTISEVPVVVPIPDKIVDGKRVPSKVIQLEMRFESSIALTNFNEIYTWGELDSGIYGNIQGNCPKLAPLTSSFRLQHGNVVRIGTGKHNVTYQMEDGTAWGVGYNSLGPLTTTVKEHYPDWPGVRMNTIP